MKIWIDDIRPIPEGYDVWIKRVDEAIDFISIHKDEISLLDLDHDAGDYFCYGGDYIKILDWMEEKGISIPISIHSGNPYGVQRMWQIIQHCGWKYVESPDEYTLDVIL